MNIGGKIAYFEVKSLLYVMLLKLNFLSLGLSLTWTSSVKYKMPLNLPMTTLKSPRFGHIFCNNMVRIESYATKSVSILSNSFGETIFRPCSLEDGICDDLICNTFKYLHYNLYTLLTIMNHY